MRQPFAAGGLYSTVEDLWKWGQALYTDRLLPTAAKQLMWTPFKENYAYGWFVSAPMSNQFGGHRRIEHGGGINGFSSAIIRLPEPNVTAIVLANNESVNASAIGRDLLAIFCGERYTAPRSAGTADQALHRCIARHRVGVTLSKGEGAERVRERALC